MSVEAKRKPGQHGPKVTPLPRVCKWCGEDSPSRLVKDKRAPEGRKRMCIPCQSSWRRMWTKTPQGQALKQRRAEEARAEREADPAVRKAQAKAQAKYRAKRKPFNVNMGAAVREWRKANGVTLKTLALAMGLPISCVSARERGVSPFTAAERVKLERAGVKFWDDEVTE